MAIGTMHIEWLSTLALRSQIPAGAAVLDLGPQDLWIEREPLQRIASRHLRHAACEKAMAEIFDGKSPRPGAQPAFYSIFGGGNYSSIDLTDPRADYAFDLNLPLPKNIGRYDVVTNFGTTEHVFNIGQAFANIHNLLNVGGIQLHAVPSYGYIDHGFYNVHPCAYLDLAKANEYEIVDILYIDNINVRMARPIEAAPFDFNTLPIQLCDMAETIPLMTKAAMLFYHNLQSPETQKVLEAMVPKEQINSPVVMPDKRLPIFIVFDLMFVALRRTSKSPEEFIAPIQGVYASMQQRNEAAAVQAADAAAIKQEAKTAMPALETKKRAASCGDSSSSRHPIHQPSTDRARLRFDTLERFHRDRKQKPLQHFCVVAFSDGKPDSTFPENALTREINVSAQSTVLPCRKRKVQRGVKFDETKTNIANIQSRFNDISSNRRGKFGRFARR
jgi:hypothetical protein